MILIGTAVQVVLSFTAWTAAACCAGLGVICNIGHWDCCCEWRGDDLFSYSGFPFHPHMWSRFCLYFFLCFEQPLPLSLCSSTSTVFTWKWDFNDNKYVWSSWKHFLPVTSTHILTKNCGIAASFFKLHWPHTVHISCLTMSQSRTTSLL